MTWIVVAVDFQPDGAHAFDAACHMARDLDAGLVLVHASPGRFLAPGPEWSVPDLHADVESVHAEDEAVELTAWAERARKQGLKVKTVHAEGDPVQTVIEAAREHEAALVVTGSHERHGVARFLMGSVSQSIVDKCDRPVLVVPQPRRRPPRPKRKGAPRIMPNP